MVEKKITDESKLFALLAYVAGWISGLIIYFVRGKDDAYVKYHAAQSIVLFGGITLLYILLGILVVPLGYIPFLGFVLVGLLYLVLNLGALILWIYSMVKAYQGEKFRLPLVTNLAESLFLK